MPRRGIAAGTPQVLHATAPEEAGAVREPIVAGATASRAARTVPGVAVRAEPLMGRRRRAR